MTGLRDVCFSYGRRKILENLSFSVGSGECIVLAGPNGSGKSTALAILAGIFRPDSGEVYTDGATGYVPQGTALFEDMTVKDNLRFFAGMAGAAIEKPLPFNVEQMWKKKVSKLSGGMKKRVSITSALIGSPRLLLFDEPCAALDVEYKEELIALIHKLKEQGRSIVYVTHDPMEVASFYDKLVYFGDPAVTYTREQLSGYPANTSVFYERFMELFH
ncbi:MAG: ATP-binding cassette domain-containing protein [Ruminococcaceae bacterium]|nr:ATP-binding cassette domain-containing protein [Oscillospiraceae bacterium]